MTTVGLDDTAITWDITDPQVPRRIGDPLTDHTNEVHTVAYRGDGAMVTGSADNNLVLWHGGTPVQPVAWDLPRLDYEKYVTDLAFGPYGRTLATASRSGEARLWDLTNPADPRGPAALPSPKGPVSAFAFRSDGAFLATGSSGEIFDDDKAEEVLLWDVRDPAYPRRVGPALLGLENDVVALQFSPDGGSLWTASSNLTLIRWNVADPDHPLMTAEALKERTDVQPMIAFRPDGAAIASARGFFDEGEVAIRDITDPTNVRLLGQPIKHRASAMLFGPDGTLLVTGGTDVLLWDVLRAWQPQQLGSPLGAGASVLSLALSADGNTLAVGGGDGTISVWDISDRRRPHRIGAPLTGTRGRRNSWR